MFSRVLWRFKDIYAAPRVRIRTETDKVSSALDLTERKHTGYRRDGGHIPTIV